MKMIARTGRASIGAATVQIATFGVLRREWVRVSAGTPMPSWAIVSATRAEALMQARVQANTLIVMPALMATARIGAPIRAARSGIGDELLA